jgi:hypothetical protein
MALTLDEGCIIKIMHMEGCKGEKGSKKYSETLKCNVSSRWEEVAVIRPIIR